MGDQKRSLETRFKEFVRRVTDRLEKISEVVDIALSFEVEYAQLKVWIEENMGDERAVAHHVIQTVVTEKLKGKTIPQKIYAIAGEMIDEGFYMEDILDSCEITEEECFK